MNQELKRSLLINTFWSFFGKVGYLLIGLITNIILVRILGPKEFGQIGIVMFFVTIFSVLIESGMAGALVRKEKIKDIDYSTVFVFNMVVSLILMLLFVSLAVPISEFYEDPDLKNVLIVVSSVLVINALRMTQTAKLIKELQFKKKITFEIIAICISSFFSILMAINDVGIWSLVALQLITSIVLTSLQCFFVPRTYNYLFDFNVLKGLYKFGVNTTIASVINSTFDNIYQIIIARYFSIENSGFYYQAKRLQDMPTALIQGTISGVVFSALSRVQSNVEEFDKLYFQIVKMFTITVAMVFLLIYYYADVVVFILYGDDWLDSVFYLKLLVIAAFFLSLESLNRIIFKVYNKTFNILKLEVLKKTIQTFSIVYGLLELDIEKLMYGFVITSMISFIINYYYAKNVQGGWNKTEFFLIVKIMLIAVLAYYLTFLLSCLFNLEGVYKLLLLPALLAIMLSMLRVFKVANVVSDLISCRSVILRSK